jgi:hypothetical protein
MSDWARKPHGSRRSVANASRWHSARNARIVAVRTASCGGSGPIVSFSDVLSEDPSP